MLMLTCGSNAVAPSELLIERLEGVRRCGRGWIARCPAHGDKSASLSLAEGEDGRVLLRCFAGCSAAEVVSAVGLQLADLFPQRLAPATPQQRAALREAAKQSDWRAALTVLGVEAYVLTSVVDTLRRGDPLTPEAHARLRLASKRIDDARTVLA